MDGTRILAVALVLLVSGCGSDRPISSTSAETTSGQVSNESEPVQFQAYSGTGISVGLAAGSMASEPDGTPPEPEVDATRPFVVAEENEAPELAAAAILTEDSEKEESQATEQPELETQSQVESETQSQVESETQSQVESETQSQAESETQSQAESETQSQAESETQSQAESETPVGEVNLATAEESSEETGLPSDNPDPASLSDTSIAPEPAPVTDSVEVNPSAFPSSTPMLTGVLPSNDIALPSYRATVSALVEPLKLTRVSTPSAFGGDATHQYSKRSAFNRTEELLEIGDAVVDRNSLTIINPYVPVSSERVWSHLQPDILYGIRYQPDPNVFAAVNVRTNDYTILRTFSDYDRCSLGNSEGNLSNDDGRVVLACDYRPTGQKTLIAYDISEDRILGTLNAEDNYNWAGFSQSGRYIVVENNTYPDPSPHIIVYDPHFQSARNLGSPGHGDFGYDDSGDEVYVMIRWDVIWYVRLKDGLRVDLSISDSNNPIGHGHISCRNLDRPGWCYFSAHKDSRLGAVRISETNSVVEHWGFHRSTSSSYNVEPKASVSRSGTQMIFTSDWLGESEDSDFLLRLP